MPQIIAKYVLERGLTEYDYRRAVEWESASAKMMSINMSIIVVVFDDVFICRWDLTNFNERPTHSTGLLDALAKGLLSDVHVTSARILSINISDGMVTNSVWWNKPTSAMGGPIRIEEEGIAVGRIPDPNYPW